MTSKTRPSLASLSDRFARKDAPAVMPETTAPVDASGSAKATTETKDTRVQVLVRMTVSERKALRQIALDESTTVQALVEETLRDLLRRHGAAV
jgi:hypothetical protein